MNKRSSLTGPDRIDNVKQEDVPEIVRDYVADGYKDISSKQTSAGKWTIIAGRRESAAG